MTDKRIVVDLAGIETAFQLRYSGTEMLFRPYSLHCYKLNQAVELSASESQIEDFIRTNHCSPEYAEFNCLRRIAGSSLTKFHRAMFHGVAFIYGGGAYILTAPSGTGKSTQFKNLRNLFGEKYNIISGDKPILYLGTNGEVIVNPSPWNGKEFWGGMEKAILRGIIILDQGKENVMRRLIPDQALLPIMQQFLYMTADETGIRVMCRLADAMLTNTPVFAYVNKGDDQSSIKLDTLIRKLECESNEVFNSAANPAGEGSRTISADCLW